MSSDIALRDDELSGKLTDLQVELARLKKYASDDDVDESVVQELDDEFKACSALLDDMKSEFKWVPTDEKGIWREKIKKHRADMEALREQYDQLVKAVALKAGTARRSKPAPAAVVDTGKPDKKAASASKAAVPAALARAPSSRSRSDKAAPVERKVSNDSQRSGSGNDSGDNKSDQKPSDDHAGSDDTNIDPQELRRKLRAKLLLAPSSADDDDDDDGGTGSDARHKSAAVTGKGPTASKGTSKPAKSDVPAPSDSDTPAEKPARRTHVDQAGSDNSAREPVARSRQDYVTAVTAQRSDDSTGASDAVEPPGGTAVHKTARQVREERAAKRLAQSRRGSAGSSRLSLKPSKDSAAATGDDANGKDDQHRGTGKQRKAHVPLPRDSDGTDSTDTASADAKRTKKSEPEPSKRNFFDPDSDDEHVIRERELAALKERRLREIEEEQATEMRQRSDSHSQSRSVSRTRSRDQLNSNTRGHISRTPSLQSVSNRDPTDDTGSAAVTPAVKGASGHPAVPVLNLTMTPIKGASAAGSSTPTGTGGSLSSPNAYVHKPTGNVIVAVNIDERKERVDRYGMIVPLQPAQAAAGSADASSAVSKAPGGQTSSANSKSAGGGNGDASGGDSWRIFALWRRNKADQEQQRASKDKEREAKWQRMLVPSFGSFRALYPDVAKKRVRKGIPDSMRGTVWFDLSDAQEMKSKFPDRYDQLCERDADHDTEQQIKKDRRRTMQHHVLFRNTRTSNDIEEAQTDGQAMLFRVLKAYALHKPSVGYCQAMSGSAAMLIVYMTEEDAFWVLERVLDSPKYGYFGGIFEPGFPLLMRFLYYHEHFMSKYCPKVQKHFETLGMTSSIYGTKWYQTVYAHFPTELVLRIWDIFLSEGTKILFRLAIFLLKRKQKELLARDFEGVAMLLQDLHKEAWLQDTDAVIEGALDVGIKHADFVSLDAQLAVANAKSVDGSRSSVSSAAGASPVSAVKAGSQQRPASSSQSAVSAQPRVSTVVARPTTGSKPLPLPPTSAGAAPAKAAAAAGKPSSIFSSSSSGNLNAGRAGKGSGSLNTPAADHLLLDEKEARAQLFARSGTAPKGPRAPVNRRPAAVRSFVGRPVKDEPPSPDVEPDLDDVLS